MSYQMPCYDGSLPTATQPKAQNMLMLFYV
jgi:hypothetical protein